jgi:hypothetical protein
MAIDPLAVSPYADPNYIPVPGLGRQVSPAAQPPFIDKPNTAYDLLGAAATMAAAAQAAAIAASEPVGLSAGTKAGLSSVYVKQPRLSGSLSGASKIKPTSWTVYLCGIDTVSNVLWAQDLNNGVLRASYDNGTTWDVGDKGTPTGAYWSSVAQIIRFKGNIYCIANPSYSNTTLAAAASSGATTLSLNGNVAVGPMVLDYNNGASQENVWVTAVSGSVAPYTATLRAVTTAAHLISAAVQAGTAIWSSPPAATNATVTSWTDVMTCTPGVVPKSCSFSTDGNYLLFAEYGDPRPTGAATGPKIWRTADGMTWTTVYAPPIGNVRHMHAVEFDPYVAGSVWATAGDGVPYTVLHSTDSGATWAVVVQSSNWQSVQISFDARYVYLAGDSGNTDVTVIDKSTNVPMMGSHGIHRTIAPPGAPAGTVYSANAYYGAVDPATGVFYATVVDTAAGTWAGMFYVPYVGGPVTIFDKGGDSTSWSMNGRVYIYNGYVYAGQYRAPLLTAVP